MVIEAGFKIDPEKTLIIFDEVQEMSAVPILNLEGTGNTLDVSNEFQYSQKHEKALKRLKNFRLLDDDFCTKVFEDIERVELLLRIILEKDNLKVTEVHSQYNMKNLQGRSARLDIFAINDTGAELNVEVQKSDKGTAPRRARYHSSLIDANIIEPGIRQTQQMHSRNCHKIYRPISWTSCHCHLQDR